MNLKRSRLLLVPALAILLLAGCGEASPASVDIDATVEARVGGIDIDATVEARLEQALTAVPTPTTMATQVPPTPTPAPAPQPTPTPVATIAEPPNPYAAAAASVVSIQTEFAGGSGVILGDAYHVVTNQHVIDGAADDVIEVSHAFEGEARRVTRASVVYEDADWDLALLRLEETLGPPIEVARKLPSLGDSLVIGGFPAIGGDTLTVTTGTVAGFEFDGLYIKIDAAIFRGNSGGAALDSHGRLVGIPTSVATDGGATLGFLIGARLLSGDFTEALLNEIHPTESTGETPYALSALGVPAVLTAPYAWDIFSTMGYLHAEQPGSDSYAVDSNFQVFGIFALDLLPSETGNDVLNRLLEESSGAFELIKRNDIDLPAGFTDTILVKATERVELSKFETRTSVLGSWIADSGLITRFAAGEANEQAVIAFDADELLTRIRLVGN
jgi:S1-C subfamily serine protease